MIVLTTDGRRLLMVRIGEPDCEQGCNKIICRDEQNKTVSILPADIMYFYGSYTFSETDNVAKQKI